jgi:hypothetical protein
VGVSELIAEIAQERARLKALLDRLTPTQMSASGAVGERSVKDVLSHIALWHAHAVTLLFRAERGQALRLLDDLNSDSLQTDPRPLENVWADFEGAHYQLVKRLTAWRDEAALFDAGRYPALRGRPLAEVIRQYAVVRSAQCRQLLEAWLAGSPTAH